MADHGVKIAKPGFDVREPITERTKKNFIILDSTEAHKIIFAGFVTGGSYTHNLNRIPFHLAFQADSVPTSGFFAPVQGQVNSTQITGLPTRTYLIVFNEGA